MSRRRPAAGRRSRRRDDRRLGRSPPSRQPLGPPTRARRRPLDLRLVPPALAAWGAAAPGAGCAAPVGDRRGGLRGGGRCRGDWRCGAADAASGGPRATCSERRPASGAGAGAGVRRWAAGQARRGAAAPGRGSPWPPCSSAPRRPPPRRRCTGRTCGGARSPGWHGSTRAEAELEVTSDPRLTRPRVTGRHAVPPSVAGRRGGRPRQGGGRDGGGDPHAGPGVVGRGRRERGADGPREPAGDGPEARWLGLLPSTRLRVTGEARAPAAGGDRVAAVLRVSGAGGAAR